MKYREEQSEGVGGGSSTSLEAVVGTRQHTRRDTHMLAKEAVQLPLQMLPPVLKQHHAFTTIRTLDSYYSCVVQHIDTLLSCCCAEHVQDVMHNERQM